MRSSPPGSVYATSSIPSGRSSSSKPSGKRSSMLDLAFERRHPDGRPQCRLRDRQIDRRVDVIAFSHEAFVRADANLDVDVSGPAAQCAGVSLAAQADALTVMDAGRDLDLERALLDHAAGAAALLARILHELARSATRRARARPDELAEDAARHLAHAAAAAARRAGADRRVRLRTVPPAAPAGNGNAERHLALGPPRHLAEVDLHLGGDVGTARTAGAPADAEEVVAEECREEVRQT